MARVDPQRRLKSQLQRAAQAHAVARSNANHTRSARDELIGRAARTMNFREIAAVVGLSHARVGQILDKTTNRNRSNDG